MEANTISRSQAVPASVAKMQAKAAQLAAELNLAREGFDAPGTARPDNTDALSPTAAAASLARPQFMAATRRMSQANVTAKPAQIDAQSALLQCQKLEAQSQMWHSKHLESERELQRHQESYLRREQQLLARLAEAEERLRQQSGQGMSDSTARDADDVDGEYDSSSTGSPGQHRPSTHKAPTKDQPLTVEVVQDQMQRGVEDLLQHQRLQLRAEEAAQLRQFRTRLAEVEAQLAADKRAAAADQDSWMSKTLAVREELARTQEIAVKLDAMYRLAEDEAARLRVQFKAQEDDRQHLIRQVLGLKRQNHQLQQQSAALQEELDAIMALEVEGQDSRAMMHQQQHPGGMPQSAGLALLKQRPMTAGPMRSIQQQDAAHWRPMSGSPNRRPASGSSSAAGGHAGDAASDGSVQQHASPSSQRVIQQLQKALQCERRQLRQLHAAHTAELGRRNELQTLLLDSIQQAKQQYQQAEAAHAAQCRADAAAPTQQQQQARGCSGASRPSSKMQARPTQQRPSSAAPVYSSRQPQQQACSVIDAGAAGSAAAGGGSAESQAGACESAAFNVEGGYLDQQAWSCLLQDLLSRQQVLELLLQSSCPDLVAAARQLHQGSHVHADATAQSPRQALLLDHPQQQQQQQQEADWASELPTQPQQQQAGQWEGPDQIDQQPGASTAVECCEGDMFMIQEDDGCSQVYSEGSEGQCGASMQQQDASTEQLTQQDGSAGHIGHGEVSAGQLDEQDRAGLQCSGDAQQEQPPVADQQEQHTHGAVGYTSALQPLQQQQQQQQGAVQLEATQPRYEAAQHQDCAQHRWGSPPAAHSWQRSPPAGSPPHAAHQRCTPAGTAVTLASMSGPLLGSFPVRKLLHSSSGGSSHQHSTTSSSRVTGSTSPHTRGAARRPESAAAAAGRQRGAAAVQNAFTLRPGSAVLPQPPVSTAPVSPSRTQHMQWQQHHQQQQQPQHMRKMLQQTQQHHKQQQQQPSSNGPEGLSIRSWGSPDGRAAQQMLKSFLSGQ